MPPFSSLYIILGSALLALYSTTLVVDAWTSSSTSSSFGGRSLVTSSSSSTSSKSIIVVQNGSTMSMKKGKSNVPPAMRGQYKRQAEMNEQQKAMMDASRPGEDGFPVFNLFVRTKAKKIWYPCGSFKGDERSAALSKSYSEDGWLSGISKNQLDGGIAGSLYSDLDQLKETVIRAYPQLRKARSDMEFGYRLSYTGLPEDKAKIIHQVDPVENKGPLDGLKNIFK